ncbi:unnamed protein product [Caenorhabditis nigoni]
MRHSTEMNRKLMVRNVGSSMYWICYQFASKAQKAIASCQGVQARNNQSVGVPNNSDSLSSVFSKVTGFQQFWQSIKNRLHFHCSVHGAPTWFVTFNPNEKEWPDLHRQYSDLLGIPVNGDNIRDVIAKDPVIFSRYWQKRVRSILKNVLLAEDGPLGNVIHYYLRTEYQHRGTEHVHALFWCSDAPRADSNPEAFVGTNKDVIAYVTAYTTKGEVVKKIDEARQSDSGVRLSQAILELGYDEINCRETGALEMVDRLLGRSCFQFDQADVWIPTDPKDKRSKMLNPRSESAEDAFLPNFIDEYYPSRPEELEEFSVYNVAVNYKIGGGSPAANEPQVKPLTIDAPSHAVRLSPHFKHSTPRHRIRGFPQKTFVLVKQRVARFFVPEHDAEDQLASEDVYRRMCVLFVPWREEDKLLEKYFRGSLQKPMPTCRVSYQSTNRSNDRDELQVMERIVDEEEHVRSIEDMKVQQRTLYDEVMACVEARKNGGPALRLFCSGTAGVGKSYVIKCIADALQLKYGGVLNQRSTPTSLLAAPTGLAAISIGGHTLHSLLGLMVHDGKDCQYVGLTDERRDLRRALFEHAEIQIIDEISMVSSVMLIQILNRLNAIKGSNEDFGGMNVLVFGDLLQLPPVRAPPIFKGVNRYLARKMFGAPNLEYNINVTTRRDDDVVEDGGPEIAGGLRKTLRLAIGCRVMLKRNVDRVKGLVNGLTGVLERFEEVNGESKSCDKCQWSAEIRTNLAADDFVVVANINRKSLRHVGRITNRTITIGEKSYKPEDRMRMGLMTADDAAALQTRMIPNGSNGSTLLENAAAYYVELMQEDARAMALLPTVEQVTTFNELVMQRLGGNIITVNASDSVQTRRSGPSSRPWQLRDMRIEVQAERDEERVQDEGREVAGGLRKTLRLAVGCRVILKRNVDRVKGLVNGLTGVLEAIEERDGNAWKLGVRTIFAPSQFYAGCNRVKTMNGLHLIDLDTTKATVDQEAVAEYTRLRGDN